MHTLPAPFGDWSIHNNENFGGRSYVSWYSNGIVAIDLRPLNRSSPRDPVLVGQFVPPAGHSSVPFLDGRVEVWGVAFQASEKHGGDDEIHGDADDRTGGAPTLFASDMNTGLWIVRPKGPAAP